LIAQVEMKKNRMYKLDLKIVQERCLKLDVKDEAIVALPVWPLAFWWTCRVGEKGDGARTPDCGV